MMAGIYSYFTQISCRILRQRFCRLCKPYCIPKHNQLFLPPMKFVGLILNCLLLYISCLPCGDSQECNSTAPQTISASTNHQEHNHNREACSPFCTCSCCAASGFFQPLSKAQPAKLIFQSAKHPVQNDSFLSQDFSSIWQPPKLS